MSECEAVGEAGVCGRPGAKYVGMDFYPFAFNKRVEYLCCEQCMESNRKANPASGFERLDGMVPVGARRAISKISEGLVVPGSIIRLEAWHPCRRCIIRGTKPSTKHYLVKVAAGSDDGGPPQYATVCEQCHAELVA